MRCAALPMHRCLAASSCTASAPILLPKPRRDDYHIAATCTATQASDRLLSPLCAPSGEVTALLGAHGVSDGTCAAVSYGCSQCQPPGRQQGQMAAHSVCPLAGKLEDAAGALPWPLPEPHGIWAAMKLPDPAKVLLVRMPLETRVPCHHWTSCLLPQ